MKTKKRKLVRKMWVNLIDFEEDRNFRVFDTIRLEEHLMVTEAVYVLRGDEAALEEMVEIASKALADEDHPDIIYQPESWIHNESRRRARAVLDALLGVKQRRGKR